MSQKKFTYLFIVNGNISIHNIRYQLNEKIKRCFFVSSIIYIEKWFCILHIVTNDMNLNLDLESDEDDSNWILHI